MEQFEVIPLKKSMGVCLGWTRQQTRDKIGTPERTINNIDYYQKRQPYFSVHYTEKDEVEFIEIANPKNGQLKVLLKEIDLFNTPADNVISTVQGLTGLTFDKSDPEIPYSYTFLELELAFWRPTVPEEDSDEDGRYFESVGIGVSGYYTE